ncbi:hypothetical protein NC653_023918, partial [Populus alba x Populus x berolinensis]
ELIPFSAFWLRSSVVSVLISLISDTGGPGTVACYWGSQASPLCCTIALAWRAPTNLVKTINSYSMLQYNRLLEVSRFKIQKLGFERVGFLYL